jgi:hypothetical protein
MVNAPAPIAIGYASATDPAILDAQREAVTAYVRAEGYALAQIVTDRWDGFTISQLVEAARLHGARLVIIPAGTTLATVHDRLFHDLQPLQAVCVVIGEVSARDGPEVVARPPASTAVGPATAIAAPRLTSAPGRHLLQHEPRHTARTHE